ncbi:hypothetical protein D5S18_23645 [Nocardia panacis]|uniref:Hsp70 family protein n=1 Tax=Nocardia panacis TaxID=2340916 RepID=A0A3A4K2N4_9NOCA|nr:Hsp70 family protein [Nocardia panacis]RJO72164.1 hypothetical protein D5S18_23645 [Nocardia panacis]
MRTSLGISAGHEVVCSALVATATNGAQRFDYRVVSADAAHSDLGDLVASSIELMTNQLPATTPHEVTRPIGTRLTAPHFDVEPDPTRPPTSVAVAYRSREQAQVIRSATGRQRELRLVPEGVAALTYLRHTGLMDRYATIAVVDLGASGLSVTVADLADETVLHSERTNMVSGNAIDDLIYHHLVDLHYARRGTRPNRRMLTNRGRAAKEHLSVAPAVTIDHVAGQPLKLTRADFEELIAGLLRETAVFAATVCARAPKFPEAVTVIGGGANIPAVLTTLRHRLDVPVVTVPDPEAVIAKGAALVADSMAPAVLPAAGSGSEATIGTFTKVVGTLAGAIVVVGLVIGYGVKEFAPTSEDHPIVQVGTSTGTSQPAPPVSATPSSGSVAGGTGTPDPTTKPTGNPSSVPPDQGRPASRPGSNAPTSGVSQPTLRPDPNLPPIPFPELPGLLGPLLAPVVPVPGVGGSSAYPAEQSIPNPFQAPAQLHFPVPRTGSAGNALPGFGTQLDR